MVAFVLGEAMPTPSSSFFSRPLLPREYDDDDDDDDAAALSDDGAIVISPPPPPAEEDAAPIILPAADFLTWTSRRFAMASSSSLGDLAPLPDDGDDDERRKR
jgi:hypothetical protein